MRTVTPTMMATTINIIPHPMFGVHCLWRWSSRYFVAVPPPIDASVRICFANRKRRSRAIYVGVIIMATKKVANQKMTIRKILWSIGIRNDCRQILIIQNINTLEQCISYGTKISFRAKKNKMLHSNTFSSSETSSSSKEWFIIRWFIFIIHKKKTTFYSLFCHLITCFRLIRISIY